jgi:signal transduction histidine kinase
VTIALQKQNTDALITVTDTGFGIPKAQQDRIFEKLFRADNARINTAEGTGLGLYLVKSILTQTGGKIWFESEENKGTKFFVTIPLSGMQKKEGTKGLS